jgi:hypothetical protein
VIRYRTDDGLSRNIWLGFHDSRKVILSARCLVFVYRISGVPKLNCKCNSPTEVVIDHFCRDFSSLLLTQRASIPTNNAIRILQKVIDNITLSYYALSLIQ